MAAPAQQPTVPVIKRPFGATHFIPKNPGAHAIPAGGTKELTWHDPKVGTGSVFFEKVFAALDGRASSDGIVTVDDLVAYLRREVRISTDQQQNPLSGDLSLHGSLGGFFFFNRRPLIEARVLPTWEVNRGTPYGSPARINANSGPARIDANSGPARNDANSGPARIDATASFNLAEAYEAGRGVERNWIEAVRLYKLAADQGRLTEGQTFLGASTR
jgi:hypothetical protein